MTPAKFFLLGVKEVFLGVKEVFLGVKEVREVKEVKAITFAGSELTIGGRASRSTTLRKSAN